MSNIDRNLLIVLSIPRKLSKVRVLTFVTSWKFQALDMCVCLILINYFYNSEADAKDMYTGNVDGQRLYMSFILLKGYAETSRV